MARLRDGEKDQISNHVLRMIRRHDQGLSEQELADLTQLERRRLNNYLNDLKVEQKIYKEGRVWLAE